MKPGDRPVAGCAHSRKLYLDGITVGNGDFLSRPFHQLVRSLISPFLAHEAKLRHSRQAMTRPRILFIGAYHPLSSSLYQRPGLRATGKSENRRIRELESMAPEFVFYPAAAVVSRHCRPALPTGHCPPGGSRQRRQEFFGESRENRRIRELKFMVPGFVPREPAAAVVSRHCRPGTARPEEVGSADRSFSGNPGKRENSGTQIYGSRIRRREPAAAVVSRHCRPALPTGHCPPGGSRQRRQEFFGGIPENRRIRELKFMVPRIRRREPAAAVVSRHCRPGTACLSCFFRIIPAEEPSEHAAHEDGFGVGGEWWAIAREPKRRITQEGTEKLHRNCLRWSVVEARGVEPLSENPRIRCSPSAVCALTFPPPALPQTGSRHE